MGIMGWESMKASVGMSGPGQLDGECFSLTYEQRIYSFIGCLVLGGCIYVLSCFTFVDLMRGEPEKFVILYTLGNIIALSGSLFLFGPMKQIKTMFLPKRRVATIVMLSTIVLTMVIAFTIQEVILIILMLIIQMCAMFWYSLSFIPFGREMFTACVKGALCK